MKLQKQVLIPGLIFIAIFSIIFFITNSYYNEKLDSVKKELVGIQDFEIIHNINLLLKSRRDLTQVEKSLRTEMKKTLFISDDRIIIELKKLHNKNFIDYFMTLIESEDKLLKENVFDKYTSVIKLLEDEKFEIADSSLLFNEPQRETYFLIHIAINIVPKAIENISKLRGLGIRVLTDETQRKKIRSILDSNLNEYLTSIEEIKHLLGKTSLSNQTKLRPLLDITMSEFHNFENNLLNIEKGLYEETPKSYYLNSSKLLNLMNYFFISTKVHLVEKLKYIEGELEYKLNIINILYISLLIFTVVIIFLNYFKSAQLLKQINIKKDEDIFITNLQKKLLKLSSLKQLCEVYINIIVEKFAAISGAIYIYDEKNYKLYLGSAYAVASSKIDTTLDIHDNIVGEVVMKKKLKITPINAKANLGLQKIELSSLLTLPILNIDKSIGAVQLYFYNDISNKNLEFLQRVISVMSTYIYRSKQEDDTQHYMKLIDKNVLIVKSDLNGNIIEASEEFCNLVEYDESEIIGKNHRIFKHEDTPHSLYVELWAFIKKGEAWRGEIKNRTKSGVCYWTDTIIIPNFDINDNIIGYTSIKHDITDKKKVEELSIIDALTGLYNRRHFDTLFEKELLMSLREKKKLAFAMVDIDYFKQYNDIYGHQEGDEALKLVATKLKIAMSRPNDYAFRLGGEEFALLFFYHDENSAMKFANKIRVSIENLKIPHSENYVSRYLTVSMGIKLIHGNEVLNYKEIFKQADEELYIAKNTGRNKVVII